MTSPVDTLKALVVEMRETERELRVEDRSVGIWPDNDTADIVKEWRERTDAAIAALSGGEASRGGEARVQLTAPERIYLAVSDDLYDESQPFPDEANWEGVCWSVDQPVAVCVPYVRADFYTTPRIPDGIDGQVIALLVAGGFVSQAKVDEARNIAISAAPGDEGRGDGGCHHINIAVGADGVRYCQHCREQLPAAPREE